MSGRIVVGVDGSPGARDALRWAVEEARLRDATLEVVTCWQLPSGLAERQGLPSDELAGAARTTVHHLLAEEGVDLSELAVVETVAEGAAAPTLLAAARGADALVVGSRGAGGFKGLLLGSVSHHCVTHASCPVVVVHPADPTNPEA